VTQTRRGRLLRRLPSSQFEGQSASTWTRSHDGHSTYRRHRGGKRPGVAHSWRTRSVEPGRTRDWLRPAGPGWHAVPRLG